MIKRIINGAPVWGTKQFWEKYDRYEKEYFTKLLYAE